MSIGDYVLLGSCSAFTAASGYFRGPGVALGVEWAQVLASQAPDFFGNIVTSKTQPFPGLFASGKCHVLVTLAKYQQFLSPKPFKFSLQPCVLSISPSLNLRWQCETLRNNRFERETIFSQSNV